VEERAKRIVADGLREAGWSPERLAAERKSHPVKVALAARLRSETTMSLRWIAENLKMGAWTHTSYRVGPFTNFRNFEPVMVF